jgi:hypothetical protein
MKTLKRKPMPTEDFYHDLFVGGYFHPDMFLEDIKDIYEVKNALYIIEKYKEALDKNNLIVNI